MKTNYNRSEIYSFFDLPTDEQEKRIFNESPEDVEYIQNDSYVKFIGGSEKKHEHFLPLSSFIRYGSAWMPNKSIWSGIFSTSYFSAYFIKLSNCGTMAAIAEKYI